MLGRDRGDIFHDGSATGSDISTRVTREQDPHLLAFLHDARQDGGHGLGLRCDCDELVRIVEACDRAEVLDRREDDLELAALVGVERVLGPDPRVRNRLAVVVQRDLLVGRVRATKNRVS